MFLVGATEGIHMNVQTFITSSALTGCYILQGWATALGGMSPTPCLESIAKLTLVVGVQESQPRGLEQGRASPTIHLQ